MESKKDPIGQELKKVRKARKISVPTLASSLGIPKDRIYKWEQGASTPGWEDKQTIEKWMKNGNWKNIPRENDAETNEPSISEQKDARIISILEKHNAFLERLVETNLSGIVTTQQLILAQVQAGQKWEARKMSKGDSKKYLEILAEVSTLAGESLQAYVGDGSKAMQDR